MKKLCALLLCALTVFCAALPARAAAQPEETITETLENGDYMTVCVGPLPESPVDEQALSGFSSFLLFFKQLFYFFAGIKTVEQSKYLRYYDLNGTLLWEAALTAEFIYSNKLARCDSVRLYLRSADPDWTFISRATEKDGATAKGTFAVKQTKLGVTLQTMERTITITCDTKGNVT